MNPSKVLIYEKDFKQIQNHISKFSKDGIETGYSLLGTIRENRIYEVKKVVFFEDVERTEVSFSTDPEKVKQKIKETGLRYLGDNHTHPWKTEPYPSTTDINQLRESRIDRPWNMIGIHSIDELKFFGMDDDSIIEIQHQIIPDIEQEKILARISEISDNLEDKKVAVLGCGSLGSGVIIALAGTGIGEYVLADMDEMSDVNVSRHLGGVYDLGRKKTEVFKKYIESHSPFSVVKTINDDLIKNRKILKAIANWADVIIASSGNPALNYQINLESVRTKKKVVYGGIYEKAESAYISYCNNEQACFDCLFGLTSQTIDNGTITRKYGLKDGELKEAQGMFSNILPVGAMMSNIALELLHGKKPECNLVRYYSSLKVERFSVNKKQDCSTCSEVLE